MKKPEARVSRIMPEIECLLVEDPEPSGPYGAKGVGESALIPTAPILGAIRDAVGVRITTLPASPDRVRGAIVARAAAHGGAPAPAR